MNKWLLTIVFSVLLVIGISSLPTAIAHGILDQENQYRVQLVDVGGGQLEPLIRGEKLDESPAERFPAGADSLVGIDMWFHTELNFAADIIIPVTVEIREGTYNGPILRTQSISVSTPGPSDPNSPRKTVFVHIDFLNQINLTPGENYVIRVVAGSNNLFWTCTTNTYASGANLTPTAIPNCDLNFRTYSTTPPGACGNGVVEMGEQCDDMNTKDGDGCSAQCTFFASGGGLDSPQGLSFGPDTNLYVSNFFGGEVLRYNDETGAFIDVFTSGGELVGPIDNVFGPDGHFYVGSSLSNQVLQYRGANGNFIDVFAGGGGLDKPAGHTFGPDGNLYVSSTLSHEVLLFDGITKEFIDVFASGSGLDLPRELSFGPDGNLYVNSGGTDQVLRYNGNTGTFVDVFASGGVLDAPQGLVIGPDGNLYVTSSFTNQVVRFNPFTGAFIDVFASGGGLDDPAGLVFGPDGNLYVSNRGTDEVLRYNGNTGTFVDVFASGGGLDDPAGLVFGPDGHLYVSSRGTDEVLRYNGNTGAPLGVSGMPGDALFTSDTILEAPNGLIFGPDGNLYVTSTRQTPGIATIGLVLRFNGVTGAAEGVSGLPDDAVFAAGGVNEDPRGVAFGPNGNLYVSNSCFVCPINNHILRFNGITGQPQGIAGIPNDAFFASGGGLDEPQDIGFGPQGNLLVASKDTGEVLRYSGANGAFIDVIASGGVPVNPFGLTFGPDRNLYVSSLDKDQVLRYNGNTGTFIDVFTSGEVLDGPHGLEFGPDGNFYVTRSSLSGEDGILQYDGLPIVSTDLMASISGPAFVTPGEFINYEITVTNNGPSFAPSVELIDVLGPGVAFNGFTTDSPSSVSCIDVGFVVCELGLMLSGESISVIISGTVQFPMEGDILTNIASVSSTAPDPNTNNNGGQVESEVTLQPRSADVSVTKDVQSSVFPGETFLYDIIVTNNGPDEARFVTLTDPLPTGVFFNRVSFTPQSPFKECHITTSGHSITCNLLTMQNGESIDISIVAVADPTAQVGDIIDNIVEVTASPDNNILNSQDTASTVVGPVPGQLPFQIGLSCAPGTDELFLNFPVFTRNNMPLQSIIPSALTCPPDFDDEIFLSDIPNGIESGFFGTVGGVPFGGFCDLDNVPEPPNFNLSFDIDPNTGDVFCAVGTSSIASMNLVSGVEDNEPPTITLPADIVEVTTFPQGKVIDYDVFASDNDEVSSLLCEPPSGSLFPVGITIVTCTAEDPSGNISEASFTITVNFVEECPPGTTPPDCEPIDGDVIGGELIPIETTSLLLTGYQSFSWMIPVVLSGIGIGLFVVSRKSK